jgi:hypothetical protein
MSHRRSVRFLSQQKSHLWLADGEVIFVGLVRGLASVGTLGVGHRERPSPSFFERLSDIDGPGHAHFATNWNFLDPAVPSHGLGTQFPKRAVSEDHADHCNHRAEANGKVLHRQRPVLPVVERRDHGAPKSRSHKEKGQQSNQRQRIIEEAHRQSFARAVRRSKLKDQRRCTGPPHKCTTPPKLSMLAWRRWVVTEAPESAGVSMSNVAPQGSVKPASADEEAATEAALLCIGSGPAWLSRKPACCPLALDGIGAFAIQALKRARTFAARRQR